MMNRIMIWWAFAVGPEHRAHREAPYLPFAAGRLLIS